MGCIGGNPSLHLQKGRQLICQIPSPVWVHADLYQKTPPFQRRYYKTVFGKLSGIDEGSNRSRRPNGRRTNRVYSFIRDVRKIGEGLGIYIPGNYGLTGGEICSIRIVPIGYLSDSEEGMWVDTEMSEDDFEYEDSPADEDNSENEETAKEFDIESLIFDDL